MEALGDSSPADPSAHAAAGQPFPAFLGRGGGAGCGSVTAGASAQVCGPALGGPACSSLPSLAPAVGPGSPLPARPGHGQHDSRASLPWGRALGWAAMGPGVSCAPHSMGTGRFPAGAWGPGRAEGPGLEERGQQGRAPSSSAPVLSCPRLSPGAHPRPVERRPGEPAGRPAAGRPVRDPRGTGACARAPPRTPVAGGAGAQTFPRPSVTSQGRRGALRGGLTVGRGFTRAIQSPRPRNSSRAGAGVLVWRGSWGAARAPRR